jgi:hypothetical protein
MIRVKSRKKAYDVVDIRDEVLFKRKSRRQSNPTLYKAVASKVKRFRRSFDKSSFTSFVSMVDKLRSHTKSLISKNKSHLVKEKNDMIKHKEEEKEKRFREYQIKHKPKGIKLLKRG